MLAQSVVSPLPTSLRQTLTVSIEGGYFSKNIFGIENQSPRILARVSHKLGGRLALFGSVGLSKLTLEIEQTQSLLIDKYRIAYGGGLNLLVFNNRGLGFLGFLGGQLFRFNNRPSSTTSQVIGESTAEETLELKYDWLEGNLSFGVAKELSFATFYTGLNLRIIHRSETRIERFALNNELISENRKQGKYKSGMLRSPLFGMDLNFPSRIKLSLELTGTNKSDFGVYVALSQSGKP